MRILDTDHCIDILRGRSAVIGKRRAVYDEVATTIITACELYYGAAKSNKPVEGKRAVDSFLRSLRVLELCPYSAQFFGVFKANLEMDGRGLADADLLIGSIARARGAVVVTGNTRHFERIPGLELENWRA
jgi:tRNA(fMet)-specific endonuclease VapC